MTDTGSVHPVPAVAGALSAFFAGTGQLYAGQRRRGIIYLLTEAAFILTLFTVLRGPLRGLVTLMPQGRFVDSRHILIVGILAGFVVIAYAWFHVANITDAVRTASRAHAARRPGARPICVDRQKASGGSGRHSPNALSVYRAIARICFLHHHRSSRFRHFAGLHQLQPVSLPSGRQIRLGGPDQLRQAA